MDRPGLPVRRLGNTGVDATLLGLGGEGVLRTFGYEAQARDVIHAALDEGITYFDSARAYAGSEQYYGGALGSARSRIFLTSKAHDRTKHGALAMLDTTLANMHTSHLDLWQLHDLRTWDELEQISAPGGAYEAFDMAKRAGKTRFIGVTGHHDTDVLRAAIERLRFDTVLLPVNPCEAAVGSFTQRVGARAIELGMGVIGMKVLARGLLRSIQAGTGLRQPPGLQELMDYALSQPLHVVIVGCDDVAHVRENADAARSFSPMPAQRQRELESRLAPSSARMLYYRPQGHAAS